MKSHSSNRPIPMRMHKRLLQFNQVVFSAGWVTDPSYSVSVKGDTQSYTNNAHGGYFPTYGEFSKIEVGSLTATVTIDFSKINCEDRVAYARFIKRQLAKSGKLWATQNGGEVIWTRARIITKNEIIDNNNQLDRIVLNLTFELIDGYWRIAKKTRTFLCEHWCQSRFKDYDPYFCIDQDELVGQCDATGNSKCYPCLANLYKPPTIIGCYDKDTPEGVDLGYYPLCHYTQRQLQEIFSSDCPNEMYIDYNCEAEDDFFCYDAGWGRKFRLRMDNTIGTNTTIVSFCSKTDLPTEFVRIRLAGSFANPTIRQLNPKYNYPQMIKDKVLTPNTQVPDKYVVDWLRIGKPTEQGHGLNLYNGVVTYGYGIKVYYSTSLTDPDGSNGGTVIDFTANTERSNTPVFQVQPGINYFEISGNLTDYDSFVYIDPIEITD